MNPVEQLLHDILTGALTASEEITTRMQALTDAELGEFEALASNAFDSIRAGEQTVEGDITEICTRICDCVDACRVEADVRFTAAAEAEAEMAALENRLRPVAETDPAELPGDPDPNADPEADPEADPNADPEADPATDPNAEPADPEAVDPAAAPADPALEPVTAAVPARVTRPSISHIAARRATPAPTARTSEQAGRVVITAGAEIPGIGAGSEIPDLERLADAVGRRADALGRMSRKSMKASVSYHVASIEAEYPEEQRLGDDAQANGRMVAELLDRNRMQSLAAAGGVCAPAAPIYTQMAIAEDTRPVRGALPTFDATRGRVITVPSPVWTEFGDGVSIWTQAMDAAAVDDDDVRKPCVRVDCADPLTWQTYAIPMCVTVGNWFQKSFPERLEAILTDLAGWQARFAERTLLDAIGDLSTNVAVPSVLGATRSVLADLFLRLASFRQRFRVSDAYRLELWMPRWFRSMVHADLVRTLPIGNTQEENLAIADARIDAWFSMAGYNVTWIWEGETNSGQEFGAIGDDWPDHMVAYMHHPGAFGLLDQGRIDLGIQRSPELNAANDMQIWSETFEGVFYQGLEAQRLDFALCPSGLVSGTDDISDLVCPGS